MYKQLSKLLSNPDMQLGLLYLWSAPLTVTSFLKGDVFYILGWLHDRMTSHGIGLHNDFQTTPSWISKTESEVIKTNIKMINDLKVCTFLQ